MKRRCWEEERSGIRDPISRHYRHQVNGRRTRLNAVNAKSTSLTATGPPDTWVWFILAEK